MRHDHTSWLIHFVRDRYPDQDFPEGIEEQGDPLGGGELDIEAKAFDVLKTIIRLGGVIPGRSFRGGRTTIYGGKPAVCATEMPLYSFAQYVKSKSDSKKVSAYGLAVKKTEFYAAGGRPVIYGLSEKNLSYKINSRTLRVFDERVLPEAEQYRYVAYNPQPNSWIDWSHEREWRWTPSDDIYNLMSYRDSIGYYEEVPALKLFGGAEYNCFFSEVYVIVWNSDEAREIQELLTGFYLSGGNNYDAPFDKKVLKNSKIIILDRVIHAVEKERKISSQTIEGIENICKVEPLILHQDYSAEIESEMTRVIELANKAAADESEIYRNKYDIDKGACGFAYASTYEITHPIIQLMINKRIANGPYDGRVNISLEGEWNNSQSIDYKEAVYKKVSAVLAEELNIQFYVHSRLD